MKAKFNSSVLAGTLIFSLSAALITEGQTSAGALAFSENSAHTKSAVSTTFRCIQNGNHFSTVANRGDRTTPPLITWSSGLGSQYGPRERCNIVSRKLTHVVALNGGKLSNLELMAGPVQNQVVICVVNKSPSFCNSSNMLFTLGPQNAKRPDVVIEKLSYFSIQGSGGPVAESSGLDSLRLEELNRFLGAEDTTNSGTASPRRMPNREHSI